MSNRHPLSAQRRPRSGSDAPGLGMIIDAGAVIRPLVALASVAEFLHKSSLRWRAIELGSGLGRDRALIEQVSEPLRRSRERLPELRLRQRPPR
jgi:hypothetical protein